jgi:molybdopterin-binding protein
MSCPPTLPQWSMIKAVTLLVQLQIGNRSKLLAQITTKSAQFLHLHTGLSVYVQIKGTSLK